MRKNLIPALIGGVAAAVLDLLVEWRLNGALTASDYEISAVLLVFVALAIFILFRNRSAGY